MQSLKITIVTVCLNAENTIKKCIQSVVDQDYSSIEYIVIDGASTDNTCRIIRQMNRADIFLSEADAGLYDAMNKAITKASGDFILFLNADDYLVNANAISQALTLMKLEEADIYYGNLEVRNGAQGMSIHKPWNECSLIAALSIYCLPHQAMLSRKSLFDAVGGFSTKFKVLSDYDWYLRAFESGARFKYMDVLISSFSFDGISSDPIKRLNEFYLIQNSSALFKAGDYDIARFESSLHRVKELESEIHSMGRSPETHLKDSDIGTLPLSLSVLGLQKKIQSLEAYNYKILGS